MMPLKADVARGQVQVLASRPCIRRVLELMQSQSRVAQRKQVAAESALLDGQEGNLYFAVDQRLALAARMRDERAVPKSRCSPARD